MESYAGLVRETLENLLPEGCHRTYKLLRLSVNFLPDWPLEIIGVFAEVAKEAEAGSSKCKPSPGSFSGDEPPAFKFSALLTEGGAERLELLRV